jgi:GT2 family glycosyltransferase
MEDVDVCKKIDLLGKNKLYYPKEEIIHVLKQGSLKNTKLFFRHSSSAIKYFLKWGFYINIVLYLDFKNNLFKYSFLQEIIK